MNISINNQQELARLNIGALKKAVKIILMSLGENNAIIGITLVNDKVIQKLNKKYRNKNKSTDVLSFYIREKDISPTCQNLLGDVVISVETALQQAKSFKHSFGTELKILLIHGILHLLDYDHVKKKDTVVMKREEKILLDVIKDMKMDC